MARHRAILFLASLLFLGALVGQGLGGERDQEGPPLSSRSSSPDGAMALALWLHTLGYDVVQLEGPRSPPLSTVALLFILDPLRAFEREEGEALLEWVHRGGVLAYVPRLLPLSGAVPGLAEDEVLRKISLGVRPGGLVEGASAAAPFFTAPQASRFRVESRFHLEPVDDAWVPLVQERGRTLAAARSWGTGRIYVASSGALFSNSGLPQADNSALILNILARHPGVRSIAFEEEHHSLLRPPSLAEAMRSSPWGWAVGYAALATFAFLLWGGIRFGPPVVPERGSLRSSGEYVSALAGLLQRARATRWLQGQYAGLVRRRLARRFGARSDLSAPQLAQLVAERLRVDPTELSTHLAALDNAPLAPRALLGRVRALENLLTEPGERRS